jgi:hypothetical protein
VPREPPQLNRRSRRGARRARHGVADRSRESTSRTRHHFARTRPHCRARIPARGGTSQAGTRTNHRGERLNTGAIGHRRSGLCGVRLGSIWAGSPTIEIGIQSGDTGRAPGPCAVPDTCVERRCRTVRCLGSGDCSGWEWVLPVRGGYGKLGGDEGGTCRTGRRAR